MSNTRIPATDEAWDERQLGADENHVKVAPAKLTEGIDEAAGMQLISIRLPKDLIEDYKLIASWNKDIGYQPLMRQILQRFADSEKRLILSAVLAEKAKEEAAKAAETAETSPAKKSRPRKVA
jgi:hypothetical protein